MHNIHTEATAGIYYNTCRITLVFGYAHGSKTMLANNHLNGDCVCVFVAGETSDTKCGSAVFVCVLQ